MAKKSNVLNLRARPDTDSTRAKRASRPKQLYPTPAEHAAMAAKAEKFRATVPPNLFVDGVLHGTLANVRSVITLFSLIGENLRDIGDNEEACGALMDINTMLVDALKHAETQINGGAR